MRLVREHPELYTELGHGAFFDRYASAADEVRKQRKENPCPLCKGTGKIGDVSLREELVTCPRCKGWGTA